MPSAAREDALELLLGPAGFELGCTECFARLDGYVELELAGADATRAIPGMRAHLQGCRACQEEYRSLLELVAGGAFPFPGPSGRRRPPCRCP
jgi:hypothetical protein